MAVGKTEESVNMSTDITLNINADVSSTVPAVSPIGFVNEFTGRTSNSNTILRFRDSGETCSQVMYQASSPHAGHATLHSTPGTIVGLLFDPLEPVAAGKFSYELTNNASIPFPGDRPRREDFECGWDIEESIGRCESVEKLWLNRPLCDAEDPSKPGKYTQTTCQVSLPQVPRSDLGKGGFYNRPDPNEIERSRTTRGERVPMYRLLTRKGASHQSDGRFLIHRKNIRPSLYMADLFHTLVHLGLSRSVPVVVAVYALITLIFASLYFAVPESCDINLGSSFIRAVFFSLETQATIGYGTDDHFFRECPSVLLILGTHCLSTFFFNAFVIGLLYTRFSRAQRRAETILFSDKAVIRCKEQDGEAYLMFQISEMRKHQIVEVHVRCYFFSHRGEYKFVSENMRLTRPNDELGAMVLLCMPTVVVHPIDKFSPMTAPQIRHDTFPMPHLRECDALQGSRSDFRCFTCGDTFCAYGDLGRHYRYNHIECPSVGFGEEATSQWILHVKENCTVIPDATKRTQTDFGSDSRKMQMTKSECIYQSLRERGYWEMVVLVEGIDTATSATLQARHSYTIDDIEYDKTFAPCVTINSSISGKDKGGLITDRNTRYRVPNKRSKTVCTLYDSLASVYSFFFRETRKSVATVDFAQLHTLMDVHGNRESVKIDGTEGYTSTEDMHDIGCRN